MIALAIPLVWLAIGRWRALPLTDGAAWATALVLPLAISPHAHMNSAVLLLAAWWFYADARFAAHRPVPVAVMLALYIALSALWIAGFFLIALTSVIVLATLFVFLTRWPSPASAGVREEPARLAA